MKKLTRKMTSTMSTVTTNATKIAHAPKHIGKENVKFMFDVTIENVKGVKLGDTYSVKWARGVKFACTKKGSTENKATGIVFNEKLSLMCTLYRASGSNDFEEKDSKISVVKHPEGDEKGGEKTIAKIHFDLAKFAGVPSATERKTFELSKTVSVDVVITSTFKGVSKGTGSSATESLSGLSFASTDIGDGSDQDELSDLDEEEEAAVMVSKIQASKSVQPMRANSSLKTVSSVPMQQLQSQTQPQQQQPPQAKTAVAPSSLATSSFSSVNTDKSEESSPVDNNTATRNPQVMLRSNTVITSNPSESLKRESSVNPRKENVNENESIKREPSVIKQKSVAFKNSIMGIGKSKEKEPSMDQRSMSSISQNIDDDQPVVETKKSLFKPKASNAAGAVKATKTTVYGAGGVDLAVENEKLKAEVEMLKQQHAQELLATKSKLTATNIAAQDKLRKENENLRDELDKAKKEMAKMKSTHEKELENAKKAVTAAAVAGTTAGAANSDLTRSVSRRDIDWQGQCLSLQRTQDQLLKENERLRAMNDEVNRELEAMETEMDRTVSNTCSAKDETRIIIYKNGEIQKLQEKNRQLEKYIADIERAQTLNESADILGASKVRELENANSELESKVKKMKTGEQKWKDTYEQLSALYEKAREENKSLRSQVNSIKGDLKKAQEGNTKIINKSKEMVAEKAEIEEDLELKTRQGAMLTEALRREAELQNELEEARARFSILEKQDLENKQIIANLETEVAEYDSINIKFKKELQETNALLLKSRNELNDKIKALEEIRVQRDDALDSLEKLKAQKSLNSGDLEILRQERDDAIIQVERLTRKRNAEADKIKDEYEALELEHQKLQRKLKDLDMTIEERDAALENLEKFKRKSRQEIEELMDERDEAVRKLDRAERAKLRALEDEAAKLILIEEELDVMKRKEKKMLTEINDLKLDNEDALNQVQKHKKESEKLKKELDKELTEARAITGDVQGELESQRKERATLNKERETLKADLDKKNEELRQMVIQLESAKKINSLHTKSDEGSFIEELVTTKIALAESEENNIKYKNMVKKLMRGDKTAFEKVAERAAKLEVQLSEAQSELQRYKGVNTQTSSFIVNPFP